MNPNEIQPQQSNTNPNQQPQQPIQPQQPPQQPNTQMGQPIVQPPQMAYSQPQPKSGSKGKMIAIFAGAIVVVAAIAVLATSLLGNKSNKTTTNSGNDSTQNTNGVEPTVNNATTSKTACQLFSLENAKSVLGANAYVVNTGETSPSIKGVTLTKCSYNSSSDGSAASLIISVQIPSDGNVKTASNLFKIKTSGDANIPGIGDNAAYDSSSQMLSVQKGAVEFDVHYSDKNGAPDQSIDEQVAKIMLANF